MMIYVRFFSFAQAITQAITQAIMQAVTQAVPGGLSPLFPFPLRPPSAGSPRAARENRRS